MANDCIFRASVRGKKAAIRNFFDAMLGRNGFKNHRLGYVQSARLNNPEYVVECPEKETVTVDFSGCCKWNIEYAFVQKDESDLLDLTNELGLSLIIYSCDPGVGFQAYHIIENGTITKRVEVEYHEIEIDTLTDREKEILASVLKLSVEAMEQEAMDGYIVDGGFENFGALYYEPKEASNRINGCWPL